MPLIWLLLIIYDFISYYMVICSTSRVFMLNIFCNLTCYVGFLPPSRRRSLFTLATSMIVFFSKAFNVPTLIPVVKDLLSESTVSKLHILFFIMFLLWRHICNLESPQRENSGAQREQLYNSRKWEQMLTRTEFLFLLY